MRSLKFVDKHPKSGVYRFCPNVPSQLRPFVPKLPGTQTLGTKDRTTAFRLALPHIEKFQCLLADAEAAHAARQANTPVAVRLTLGEAGRLIEDWKCQELGRIAGEIANLAPVSRSPIDDRAQIESVVARGIRYGLTRRLLIESERGRAEGVQFLRQQTERVLASGGFAVPCEHPMFVTASSLVRAALREIVDLDEKWCLGNWTSAEVAQFAQSTPTPTTIPVGATAATGAAPLPPRRNPIRISELVERHISRTNPPISTASEQRLAVRRFLNVLGQDLFFHEVDYAHAEEFYEVLVWLPRGRTEDEERLPLVQLAEAVRTGKLQKTRITRNNADKQVALLGAMFR